MSVQHRVRGGRRETVDGEGLMIGTIVRYEESRGYGFVAPDEGGEDVFIHANDLSSVSSAVGPGTRLAFRVVNSARGPKALDVQVLTRSESSDRGAGSPPARTATGGSGSANAEDLCEVLPERRFLSEVTELILSADGTVTATQLLAIRAALSTFAKAYGWVE